eukprot:6199007-Pleurochrysis_carterae.AAC.1
MTLVCPVKPFCMPIISAKRLGIALDTGPEDFQLCRVLLSISCNQSGRQGKIVGAVDGRRIRDRQGHKPQPDRRATAAAMASLGAWAAGPLASDQRLGKSHAFTTAH